MKKMEKALAIFETKGFAPAIAATEIILKELSIKIRDIKIIGDGNVSVFFSGDIQNLKAAIDRGVKHARSVGKIIGVYIYSHPKDEVEEILFDRFPNRFSKDLETSVKDIQNVKPNDQLLEKQTPTPKEKSVFALKSVKKFDTPVKAKSTIQRLRDEALSIKESKKDINDYIASDSNNNDKRINLNKIESLNVHELRRLARATHSFPIQGREISRALRKELIEYFKELA